MLYRSGCATHSPNFDFSRQYLIQRKQTYHYVKPYDFKMRYCGNKFVSRQCVAHPMLYTLNRFQKNVNMSTFLSKLLKINNINVCIVNILFTLSTFYPHNSRMPSKTHHFFLINSLQIPTQPLHLNKFLLRFGYVRFMYAFLRT
jgi:hypothetical protein